jgi:hypothetical protein
LTTRYFAPIHYRPHRHVTARKKVLVEIFPARHREAIECHRKSGRCKWVSLVHAILFRPGQVVVHRMPPANSAPDEEPAAADLIVVEGRERLVAP